MNPLNSYRKWNIGSLVREMLLGDKVLQGLLNEHIYPCIAPEGTEGSFIIYRREKYSRENVKQGPYEDDCRLSITVISDSYDVSLEIAGRVDEVLSGRHQVKEKATETDNAGTSQARLVRMELADSTEGWEDSKYYQILVYSIR